MCGRFAAMNLEAEGKVPRMIKKLAAKAAKEGVAMKTKGEVFPTDTAPVLIEAGDGLEALPMTWGYPGFPDRKRPGAKPRPLINTKSETAGSLGTWKDSMLLRRCLVPTGGFFEWEHRLDKKTKLLFYLKGEEGLYLGGIYKEFITPEGPVTNFSILTLAANDSMRDVHDRMPLVVLPSEFGQWFGGGYEGLYDRRGVGLARKA